MISLKTSLKKLYNKVTGKKTNKESISEIVNQLADDYKGGTEVIVNPELEGNEDLLNGLQVGDTKYAMPHLYRYWVYDSDYSAYFYASELLDEIYIDASTSELSDVQKVALTKLWEYIMSMPGYYLILVPASQDSNWVPQHISIYASLRNLNIQLVALDSEHNLDYISGDYAFNVEDRKVVSINNIDDTTFGDGFNLKRTKIF